MVNICKTCKGKGVVVKDGLTWTCETCYGLGRVLDDEVLRSNN